MTTVTEAITEFEKDGRKRCDKKPYKDCFVELTTREVHRLMKVVITWADDPNPITRKSGKEGKRRYPKYLKTPINEIPEKILNDMYGHIYTLNGKFYTYTPCCK